MTIDHFITKLSGVPWKLSGIKNEAIRLDNGQCPLIALAPSGNYTHYWEAGMALGLSNRDIQAIRRACDVKHDPSLSPQHEADQALRARILAACGLEESNGTT